MLLKYIFIRRPRKRNKKKNKKEHFTDSLKSQENPTLFIADILRRRQCRQGGTRVSAKDGAFGVVNLARDKKVSQRIHQLNQILLAEKFVAENPLHLSPEIMDENVGLAGLRAPGQNRRCEDGRHSPGGRRKVPFWPVDENDVPRNLINVVGQIVDGELAFGE